MRYYELTEAVDPKVLKNKIASAKRNLKDLEQKQKEIMAAQKRGAQGVIDDRYAVDREIRDTKAKLSFLESQLEIHAQGQDTLDQPDKKALPVIMPPHNKHGYKRWQESLKPAVEKIKRDCAPFLKEIGNDLTYGIFRGTKGTNAQVMTGRVRLDDRKAMSSGDEIHNYLNKYFIKTFNAPFRNAMFVSGSANFAKDYGNLYLVFPVGDFKYIWSPEVKDLYYLENDMDEALYGEVDEPEEGKGDVKAFYEFMDGQGYINTDLLGAAESENEIMIRCKFYYGINLTAFFGRIDDHDDDFGQIGTLNKAIALIQDLL